MPRRTGPLWAALDPWLLLWMGLGLALRVGVTLAVSDALRPQGDEGVYLRHAAALRLAGVLDTGEFVRPPLYFALLAGLSWPAEWLGISTRLLASLLQCALGTAVALPVHAFAQRIAGARAARTAVAALMLDPTLIAYCHLIWPETLFTLLIALVFHGVAGLEERPRAQVALLGVVTGLALLLKPVFGLFTLLLALHWLQRLGWRGALRLVLVFGGAAALVIAPWLVRNQLRYGPAILLENQGPYTLWIGNDPAPARDILEEWRALPDAKTRSRVGTERGLRAIADDPAGFARRGAGRLVNLWGPEFFVVRHAVIGGYGPIGPGTLLALFWTVQLGWLALLLAAAAGVPAAGRDPTFRLILAYAGVLTLLVFGLVATTRFRVPLALPLAVAAGVGVDRLRTGRLARAELAAVLVAAAVFGLSAARPLFRTIAFGDWSQVRELRDDDWRFFRY